MNETSSAKEQIDFRDTAGRIHQLTRSLKVEEGHFKDEVLIRSLVTKLHNFRGCWLY